MTVMEQYLDLIVEYQKAKTQAGVMRTQPVERTPALIAEEAKDALLKVLSEG